MDRLTRKALKLHTTHDEFLPQRRKAFPYWWADFGCSIHGGTVMVERNNEEHSVAILAQVWNTLGPNLQKPSWLEPKWLSTTFASLVVVPSSGFTYLRAGFITTLWDQCNFLRSVHLAFSDFVVFLQSVRIAFGDFVVFSQSVRIAFGDFEDFFQSVRLALSDFVVFSQSERLARGDFEDFFQSVRIALSDFVVFSQSERLALSDFKFFYTMGKPNGGQRASGSGASSVPPKQVRVKNQRDELVALGDSSVESGEDLRSQTSRSRAEKARRKREKKKQRMAENPAAALDALLRSQSHGRSVLAIQCASPSPSHDATEVATEAASVVSQECASLNAFQHAPTPIAPPLSLAPPGASPSGHQLFSMPSVAQMPDSTVTRRDLENFGERLSSVFAQALQSQVVPQFAAMDSRLTELEARMVSLSSQVASPNGQSLQPAPTTPPPPGPLPPPHTPSRALQPRSTPVSPARP
eukprot:5257180-Amphidinium_carterae.1